MFLDQKAHGEPQWCLGCNKPITGPRVRVVAGHDELAGIYHEDCARPVLACRMHWRSR